MSLSTNWREDIEVVDIVNDLKELNRLFSLATEDYHRNSGNYKNYHERYEDYIAFHAIYKKGDPIAFSGVYEHSQWKDCVRIADRSYYFPEYRVKTLKRLPSVESKNQQKIDAVSRIFIPLHLKIAKEHNKIPFITIQEEERRIAMDVLLSHVNSLHDIEMVMLDKMRFVGTKGEDFENDRLWHSVGCLKQDQEKVSSVLPRTR